MNMYNVLLRVLLPIFSKEHCRHRVVFYILVYLYIIHSHATMSIYIGPCWISYSVMSGICVGNARIMRYEYRIDGKC